MIRLENILTPGRSLVNVPGGSKKRVLEQIANLVARDLPGLDAPDIFEGLVAREKLGWVPEITVQQMCAEMVANDLNQAKQHALLKQHGFDVAISREN